jgi:hypothetical protein
MGKGLEALAAVIAIIAGIYMLTTQAATENSIFNPLLHGIGLYFLARGIWMLRHAGRTEDIVDRLDRLIVLNEDDEPAVPHGAPGYQGGTTQ